MVDGARRLRDVDPAERARLLRRSVGRVLLTTTLLLAGYYSLPLGAEGGVEIAVRTTLTMTLAVVVVVNQLRAAVWSPIPQLRAFEALALAAALLVVLFAALYGTLSRSDPEAFTERLDQTGALYFTMTTLSTVGYGDIAARSDAARIIVMVQMVANVTVLGFGIRLVFEAVRRRLDATPDEPER